MKWFRRKQQAQVKEEGRTFYMPGTFDQVTLGQYITFRMSVNDADKVCAAIGCDLNDVAGMKLETVQQIIQQFEAVLSEETKTFARTVDVGFPGGRLGFIPDLNAMTLGEYVDLDSYAEQTFIKGDMTYWPKLMSVLYRPVTDRVGDHYRIRKYDSENRGDYMPYLRNLKMDAVMGAMLFFSTCEKELRRTSLDYLTRELKKMKEELRKMEDEGMDLADTDGSTSLKHSQSVT